MTESLFYTIEETAEVLKLPKSKIYELVNQVGFPATKLGKHWRINKKKLEKWCDDRC